MDISDFMGLHLVHYSANRQFRAAGECEEEPLGSSNPTSACRGHRLTTGVTLQAEVRPPVKFSIKSRNQADQSNQTMEWKVAAAQAN